MSEECDRVRRFNRTVTRSIGALDASFLGRGLSLGEARALYEIGSGGVEVRRLRAKLGLDSGYTSRLLRSLERKELVATQVSALDARVRLAQLTRRGEAELERLGRLSDERAEALLAPLDASRRGRLLAAMREVERLLIGSEVRIRVEDPASAAARWCLDAYVLELGERFEGGFDPAASVSAEPEELRLPAGCFFVADRSGEPVGCGGLKLGRGPVAEVKRMWVSRDVRGMGVGQRLLDAIEQMARERGVLRLRLETNRALEEALALYRRNGYRQVKPFSREPYAHYWLQKRLARSRR